MFCSSTFLSGSIDHSDRGVFAFGADFVSLTEAEKNMIFLGSRSGEDPGSYACNFGLHNTKAT